MPVMESNFMERGRKTNNLRSANDLPFLSVNFRGPCLVGTPDVGGL